MKKWMRLIFLLFLFTVVVLPVGASVEAVTILIDEQQHDFTPSPFIMDGKMYVSLDEFCGALDAKLEQFNDGKAYLAYRDEVDLSVSEESALPKVNGEEVELKDPVQIIEGTPFVPLRLAAERLGYNVRWDEENRVVTVNECGEKEVGFLALDEEAANDEEGLPEGTGEFIWPVQGGQITSYYGMRNGRFHQGIDIGAPNGTAILASDRGTVVFAGWYYAYGRLIIIKHGEYFTYYAHNSANKVSVGGIVEQGEVIGYIGASGNATGSHLHFEIRSGGIRGKTYNPLNYISR